MLSAFIHFSPRDRGCAGPVPHSDRWLVQDCTVENVDRFYTYNYETGGWQMGQPVAGVTIRNVTVTGALRPIEVLGDADRQFALTLENVDIALRGDAKPAPLISVRQFGSLRLRNVVLRGASAPVLWARAGDHVSLAAVVAPDIGGEDAPFDIAEVGTVRQMSSTSEGWATIPCPRVEPRIAQTDPVEQILAEPGRNGEAYRALEHTQSADTQLVPDPETRFEGAPTLRAEYAFGGKKQLEFVNILTPVTIDPADVHKGLGFWFRFPDDAPRFPLAIRITDSTGETHQYMLVTDPPNRDGWRFAAVMLGAHHTSWGGNADRELDVPCRLQIVLDRPCHGFAEKGVFHLGPICRVTQRKAPELIDMSGTGIPFGHVFEPGATPVLHGFPA